MFVQISDTGDVTLEETGDFKRFHIDGDVQNEQFLGMAEDAGDNHFWLDADAIVRISGQADDKDWCEAFWAMLGKAEPFGFADVAARRIKAHVV